MGDFQPSRNPPITNAMTPELGLPFNLPTDDADQQFWGDNELESTSVSDMEGVGGAVSVPNEQSSSYNTNNRRQMSRGVRNTRFCWSNLTKDQLSSRFPQKNKVSPHQVGTQLGAVLTQLSSFSVGPDGHSQANVGGRGGLWKRPATRDRYRAAKEAREAAINAQGFSSSSDSDFLMERPTKARRRSRAAPSDEDSVMTSPGEVCPTCQYRAKNAIIVHGRIGHACFCYPCTMKLLRTGGECPMCGRKIRKVVKTIRTKRDATTPL